MLFPAIFLVLGQIAKEVHSIERIPKLANKAEKLIVSLGYSNVHVHFGDGTLGLPEEGEFDAIVVTAGAPVIPEILMGQLKVGGRMIIPVGDRYIQQLLCLTKSTDNFTREVIEAVRFVPLIGKEGW